MFEWNNRIRLWMANAYKYLLPSSVLLPRFLHFVLLLTLNFKHFASPFNKYIVPCLCTESWLWIWRKRQKERKKLLFVFFPLLQSVPVLCLLTIFFSLAASYVCFLCIIFPMYSAFNFLLFSSFILLLSFSLVFFCVLFGEYCSYSAAASHLISSHHIKSHHITAHRSISHCIASAFVDRHFVHKFGWSVRFVQFRFNSVLDWYVHDFEIFEVHFI